MRYTAVFEWPHGERPVICSGDGWNGGKLCSIHLSDALQELQRLRAAARHYCFEYLQGDLETFLNDERRAAAEALLDAVSES